MIIFQVKLRVKQKRLKCYFRARQPAAHVKRPPTLSRQTLFLISVFQVLPVKSWDSPFRWKLYFSSSSIRSSHWWDEKTGSAGWEQLRQFAAISFSKWNKHCRWANSKRKRRKIIFVSPWLWSKTTHITLPFQADVRPAWSLAKIMEMPDLWSWLSKRVSFINTP